MRCVGIRQDSFSILRFVLGCLFYGLAYPAVAEDVATSIYFPSVYQYSSEKGTPYFLDVYSTSARHSELKPALIFFHGGAWQIGDKAQFFRQAQILLQKTSLIVVSVNYPLHLNPIESTIFAQAAVCWVKSHAQTLGIDPKHLVLSGGSAGGQLAIAVALIDSSLSKQCSRVTGPYANMLVVFNPALLNESWVKNFGRSVKNVAPMELIHDHRLPPTMILQGTADTITPIENARLFVRKARAGGSAEVVLIEFAGRQHGFFNNDGDLNATVNYVIDFIKKQNWPITK